MLGMDRIAVFVLASPIATMAMDAATDDAHQQARAVQRMIVLVAATTLLVILAIMVLTIIRFTRGWREQMSSDKSAPTPTSDVWSQHKLPEEVQKKLDELGEGDSQS